MAELVHYDIQNRVAVLTIDNPPVNAMGPGVLEGIEEQVIDPSDLSEREKAALWLFGWSFVNRRRQRREAAKHIELLAGDDEAAAVAPRRTGLVRLISAR